MTEKMKILIGYDGTKGADLALDDLRRAGLPREAEVLVVSVAEPSFVLSGPGSLEMIIARDSIFGKEKAQKLAEKAVERIRSDFPGWRVEEAVVRRSTCRRFTRPYGAWPFLSRQCVTKHRGARPLLSACGAL
jgi:nucleotide-binding universal stress UspA family protein